MEYQTLREYLGEYRNLNRDHEYTFMAKHSKFGWSIYNCYNTRSFIESYPNDEEILDRYEVVKERCTGTGFEYVLPYTLEVRLKKEFKPKVPRKTKEQRAKEKTKFEWRVKGNPWLEKLLSRKIVVNKGYDVEQTLKEAFDNFHIHRVFNADGTELDYDTVKANLDKWKAKTGSITIKAKEGNCFYLNKE